MEWEDFCRAHGGFYQMTPPGCLLNATRVEANTLTFKCDTCGRTITSQIGLISHCPTYARGWEAKRIHPPLGGWMRTTTRCDWIYIKFERRIAIKEHSPRHFRFMNFNWLQKKTFHQLICSSSSGGWWYATSLLLLFL